MLLCKHVLNESNPDDQDQLTIPAMLSLHHHCQQRVVMHALRDVLLCLQATDSSGNTARQLKVCQGQRHAPVLQHCGVRPLIYQQPACPEMVRRPTSGIHAYLAYACYLLMLHNCYPVKCSSTSGLLHTCYIPATYLLRSQMQQNQQPATCLLHTCSMKKQVGWLAGFTCRGKYLCNAAGAVYITTPCT